MTAVNRQLLGVSIGKAFRSSKFIGQNYQVLLTRQKQVSLCTALISECYTYPESKPSSYPCLHIGMQQPCCADDPVVRTWAFRQPEKERRRTASAPRNLRNTRRLRNRFVFDSSSDEEDEDSPDGTETEEAVSPRSNAMHLSQSLPSRLNTSQCRNGQSR